MGGPASAGGQSIGQLGHHPGLHVDVNVEGMTIGGISVGSEQWVSGVVVGLSELGDFVTINLDTPMGEGRHAQQRISIDDPARVRPRELTEVHPEGVPDEILELVRKGKKKQAAKQYRALNGATLDEALAFIASIEQT